jgi:hypothetical protein
VTAAPTAPKRSETEKEGSSGPIGISILNICALELVVVVLVTKAILESGH